MTTGGGAVLVGYWNDEAFVPNISGYIAESDAPVPEPASLTLLGVGLAGLGARCWRQRMRARAARFARERTTRSPTSPSPDPHIGGDGVDIDTRIVEMKPTWGGVLRQFKARRFDS